MAIAVTAAVSLPSSKSTSSLSTKTSILSPERIKFNKVPLYYRNVSAGRKFVTI